MEKALRKRKRQKRVRGKIVGTATRPRFSVFRSNAHMFAQIIDDEKKMTLCALSDTKINSGKEAPKGTLAKQLGIELAKKALEKKIKKVVFDKGSYAYHGRVKAVAEGAREGGLEL